MGTAVEAQPSRALSLKSSSLKKPFSLRCRDARIVIDPDGAVRSMDSLSERRALFGFEQLWFYKLQAGVVVQMQRPDWMVRIAPRSAQLASRLSDVVEASQVIEFFRGSSSGYVRRLRLRNAGQSRLKLRVLDLMDPTASRLGDVHGRWGSLGVNAFNRGSHVAMDEVSEPPSARVIGADPPPLKFYMTTDRSRAQDIVARGELSEASAGMSGQVIILSAHDIELGPSESVDLAFVFIYNSAKLEDALSEFGRLQNTASPVAPRGTRFSCSSSVVSDAASWALAYLEGAAYTRDLLDRVETLGALALVEPPAVRSVSDTARRLLRRDGSLPHSMDPGLPGMLETAVLLKGLASSLAVAQDKRAARQYYPLVKQMAGYLMGESKDFAVRAPVGAPQGWRRQLGTGFPTGEVPEVALAFAEALLQASRVSRLLAKSEDAGRFRERSEMIGDSVAKRLTDERGFLSLCLDSSGKLHADETVDMAVAAYRHHSGSSAEQAAAHRMLEKDFETPYGPRCVPTTNPVYFNRTYGKGQLGGFWTRAALAHAVVCYRAGLSGIASLELKKVARLVTEDGVRMGGAPGEFPMWADTDAGETHGDEGDPVAAARFIEALAEGELGFSASGEGSLFSPTNSSSIGWLLWSDFWTGEPTTAFVGRSSGRTHVFYSANRLSSKGGFRFSKSEGLDLSAKGITGASFYNPGQTICIGSSNMSQSRVTVSFAPRGADLTKHLSVSLESYDPGKDSWTKVGTMRVQPAMSFDAVLGPEEWKAFRVSTA